MDARRWGLAGLAFVAGLVLASVALAADSGVVSFSFREPIPLVVEVHNADRRDARIQLDVEQLGGGAVQVWELTARGGATEVREQVELPQGRLRVELHGSFALGDQDDVRATAVGDPSSCSRGEALVVAFRLATTGATALAPRCA